MNETITEFSGEYRWLSNFWGNTIIYDGVDYPSTEHAYQASKTKNHEQRINISVCGSPGKAKRLGQKVDKRSDWKDVKLEIMYEINMQKFTSNESLKQALIDTGDAVIVEGNNWNDTFWGVCDGVGHNHLGRILMRIRDEIK